jgi:hypothetical protein
VQEARHALDYPLVSTRFRFIEEETCSVVVPYEHPDQPGEVEHLLQREPQYPREFFRQLQPYLIQMRASVFAQAQRTKRIEEVFPGVWLWTDRYDPSYGVVFGEE